MLHRGKMGLQSHSGRRAPVVFLLVPDILACPPAYTRRHTPCRVPMLRSLRNFPILAMAASAAALLLTACGGGDGSGSSSTPPEAGAPAMTGDVATDGFNWFNFRRQQLAMPTLQRNGLIDTASFAHSRYQALNNTITHDETAGLPGFTGSTIPDRLAAAGYTLGTNGFAFGEVI